MSPLTESAIRASFVNCTKGEAKRLDVPKDLAERPWGELDFLGWADPSGADRAFLVAETENGPVGIALRKAAQTGPARRSMCSLCLTAHDGGGVSLMTARKAGPSGRQGNSVGVYICGDLACSSYVRGKKEAGRRLDETITESEKIERTRAHLDAFVRRVLG